MWRCQVEQQNNGEEIWMTESHRFISFGQRWRWAHKSWTQERRHSQWCHLSRKIQQPRKLGRAATEWKERRVEHCGWLSRRRLFFSSSRRRQDMALVPLTEDSFFFISLILLNLHTRLFLPRFLKKKRCIIEFISNQAIVMQPQYICAESQLFITEHNGNSC